eukprot:m.259002 g.259002  ORF g.259002 m.259002 type:complete len:150 (+) comp37438_c0_seq1:73-522(+)
MAEGQGMASPQQLDQMRQELQGEVEYLTNSLKQLKGAQEKYVNSLQSLESITSENDGNEVLVPLTGTLYAKGTLDTDQKVLVDVGTGYFIEKSVPGAKDFFKRRNEYLKEKMEQIQPIVMAKMKEKHMVEEMLQATMAKIEAAQAKQKK